LIRSVKGSRYKQKFRGGNYSNRPRVVGTGPCEGQEGTKEGNWFLRRQATSNSKKKKNLKKKVLADLPTQAARRGTFRSSKKKNLEDQMQGTGVVNSMS